MAADGAGWRRMAAKSWPLKERILDAWRLEARGLDAWRLEARGLEAWRLEGLKAWLKAWLEAWRFEGLMVWRGSLTRSTLWRGRRIIMQISNWGSRWHVTVLGVPSLMGRRIICLASMCCQACLRTTASGPSKSLKSWRAISDGGKTSSTASAC